MLIIKKNYSFINLFNHSTLRLFFPTNLFSITFQKGGDFQGDLRGQGCLCLQAIG